MNKTAKTLMEIYGWYGTAAILLAYFLVSFGFAGDLVIYQALNFTGSVALGIVAYVKKAWQPLVLEIVWAAIALASLFWLILR